MKSIMSKKIFLALMRKTALLLPLFIALVLIPALCFAQEGDLDLSFGENGKVITNLIGANDDRIKGMDLIAIQSDGKIVVAGYTIGAYSLNSDFALARYHFDGSLDTSFGEDGHVVTDFSAYSDDVAQALAIQADGKIVVVGSTNSFSPSYLDFAIARYNPDGSLDTSFGEYGLVINDFDSPRDEATAVIIQADGKILVAGKTFTYSTAEDFAIARYNPDGSLDSGFGTGGLVTTDFTYGSQVSYDDVRAVTIQTNDNKIIVAGSCYQRRSFALARYNPDGSLDINFGINGLVKTQFPGSSIAHGAFAVEVQSDGKILAAGDVYFNDTTSQDFALARYNSDGILDSTFGNGGLVTTSFYAWGSDACFDLAIQNDDKIVLVGRAGGDPPLKIGMARYNTDGSLDTNFGIGGKVVSVAGEAWSVALQSDGMILVAGYSSNVRTGLDFTLARYDIWGSLDSTFGNNGLVFDDFLGPNDDFGKDVIALQGDGKIVVVGYTWSAGSDDIAVVRYNPDGSLDTGFGDGGIVVTDFDFSFERAYAVAIQDDGKMVVVGEIRPFMIPDLDFAVVRYNPDGSLDSGFGTGGLVTTDFDNSADTAQSVAIQNDGKIVVVGGASVYVNHYSYRDFAIARYNSDGSLDTGFGNGGLVTTNLSSNYNWPDQAYAVAIQDDGKIVVGGQAVTAYINRDFAVARYNQNGSLDTSYGIGGFTTIDFGSTYEFASGLDIQADGKIIISGYTRRDHPFSDDFALARYTPNGILDDSFGSGGLVTTDFGGTDRAYDLALQADGKVLVAGTTWGDFALARYTPNGILDDSFGSGGLVTTDFGDTDDQAYGMSIQADGKIILAGSSNRGNPYGYDFALARYEGLKSPDEAIDDIIDQIQDLVSNEVINNGQGISMLKKLQNALQLLDNGNIGPTINLLESFIQQVNGFILNGILTPDEGQQLISAAQEVIDRLQS